MDIGGSQDCTKGNGYALLARKEKEMLATGWITDTQPPQYKDVAYPAPYPKVDNVNLSRKMSRNENCRPDFLASETANPRVAPPTREAQLRNGNQLGPLWL